MARIRIGVIGPGDIARVRFFPSIAAIPELRLAGVLSRRPESSADIVARHGGRAYGDLDAFLADPDIDAVIVATPHPSHAALSIRALAAGKHVLVEKPMATSLADARHIQAAAASAGRVCMALPFDATAPMAEARRLIRAGAIGRVTSVDAVLAHRGPTHAPWFVDRAQSEWGVLADLGVYLISALTFLFGRAASVSGQVATLFPERTSADGVVFPVTVEDSAAAILTWPGNLLGSIRANWCSAADKRSFIWDTSLYGTEGTIFIDMAAASGNVVVHSPDRPVAGAEPVAFNGMSGCYRPALPAWDLHRDIVQAFADAIAGRRSGADDGTDAAHQAHVIEIIEKLYESSRSGTVQRLD